MASRKKKTTQKFKQTRATKNESSKVNTNESQGTSLIYATDTAAKPSIEQAMSNDSSSASITQELGNAQASTTGASSSRAGASATGAATIKPSQKAVAQIQCPLFLLPTEVRLMIYKHVFHHETIVTGAVNKNTFARIYTIDQFQDQHPLALLKTCRSIHAEVKELVNPRSIVRDIPATTVVRHVYGDSWEQSVLLDHVDLLRKMAKLWKPVQTPMTEHPPISAGAPSIGPVITEAVAQTQCRIFLLPAELRKMIYNYVFDTGTIDKKTLARVYEIGKRRQQRIQNLAIRKNNFKLENIIHHHFALLKTCRTIYAECKPFFDSKVVYRFTSPLAVASFLCGGNLDLPRFSPPNLDVLDKAVKVQVVVDPAQGDSPILTTLSTLCSDR
ncbi:hypothetical protein KCU92_g4800, partial [Aureobasidium melanogenum]